MIDREVDGSDSLEVLFSTLSKDLAVDGCLR